MVEDDEEGHVAGHENIRRVYALPTEMVDRITRFQRTKGLSSEVEAVRRLLDEALKSRDDLETIINRLLARLSQTKIISEAARDVLAGHPLVASITFHGHSVTFNLKNDDPVTVYEHGTVFPSDVHGKWHNRDKDNLYAGGSFDIPF